MDEIEGMTEDERRALRTAVFDYMVCLQLEAADPFDEESQRDSDGEVCDR